MKYIKSQANFLIIFFVVTLLAIPAKPIQAMADFMRVVLPPPIVLAPDHFKLLAKAAASEARPYVQEFREYIHPPIRKPLMMLNQGIDWVLDNKLAATSGALATFIAYKVYKNHLYTPNENIVFDQALNGIYSHEASEMAHDFIEVLQAPDQNLYYPRLLLLVGSPGTGKTELAKAISNGRRFQEQTVTKLSGDGIFNDGPNRIRNLFNQASQAATPQNPVILFFDEIDQLTPDRNAPGNHHASTALTTALIVQITNLQNPNVFIIGTTNVYEKMDAAVRDRFNTAVHKIEELSDAERNVLITHHLNNWVNTAPENENRQLEADLSRYLAEQTSSFTNRCLVKGILEPSFGDAIRNARRNNLQEDGRMNVLLSRKIVDIYIKRAASSPINFITRENLALVSSAVHTTSSALQVYNLYQYLFRRETILFSEQWFIEHKNAIGMVVLGGALKLLYSYFGA